jgi:preprotein translocase subunit SecA
VRVIYSYKHIYKTFDDEQLCDKTIEFIEVYQKGESLDLLLPEAFAIANEGALRLCGHTIEVCGYELEWNMVHFDFQLIERIALPENRITEMAMGNGKTLVPTFPLYLNALTGPNCELAMVND